MNQPNPNMTYEELRTQLDRLIIENRDETGNIDLSDQSAMRDEIIQLFAIFMDSLLTNAVVEKNFTKEVDAYIKKVRAEFWPLTTKNTEEENV